MAEGHVGVYAMHRQAHMDFLRSQQAQNNMPVGAGQANNVPQGTSQAQAADGGPRDLNMLGGGVQ